MTPNGETRKAALIHGSGSTLGRAVALELIQAGVRIALYDEDARSSMLGEIREAAEMAGGEAVVLPSQGELLITECRLMIEGTPGPSPISNQQSAISNQQEALVSAACEALGGLDLLVSLLVPHAQTEVSDLYRYPAALLERGLAAGARMGSAAQPGTIVHHCFLPAAYAETPLDPYMPTLKSAIVGVTRTLCRKLGPAGIRVNCVLTGLVDMPETRLLAGPRLQGVKVPIGRWGRPEEIARLIRFLALEPHYMSGQALLMDGGLTPGMAGA